jgi:hypothetical protein
MPSSMPSAQSARVRSLVYRYAGHGRGQGLERKPGRPGPGRKEKYLQPGGQHVIDRLPSPGQGV